MGIEATIEPREVRRERRLARSVSLAQRQGALVALVAVVLFGSLRYGSAFYGNFNVFEALRNNTYYGLIALGMTFVIMTGGIDLSVGSVVAASAVVAAQLSGHGLAIATSGAVGFGLTTGLVNGVLIARFRIQPFIVTLATLLAGRGMALLLSHNATVPVDFQSGFIRIGQANVGRVPVPVIIVALAYVLGSIALNFTRFGRHVLAIGGNAEAARLAGVPVARTLLTVYLMSGALAGLAGAILAAIAYSGPPTIAVGWELSAIAAVVVGGTLLTGGMGSVGTTLVGILLLGSIFTILNFENVTPYWQNVIRGGFLLIVVIPQSRLLRRMTPTAH